MKPALLALTALALSTFACDAISPDASDPTGSVGEIALPLRVTAVGGGQMRLVGASFVVKNATGTVVATPNGDTGQTTVTVRLTPGAYTVQLLPGWNLQLEVDGVLYDAGQFDVVENPIAFNLTAGGKAQVKFDFRRSASVDISINAPGRLVTGSMSVDHADGNLQWLIGTATGFSWDVNSTTRTFLDPNRTQLDFTSESFAWDGDAPQALVDMFASYHTGETANLLLWTNPGDATMNANLALEFKHGADIVSLSSWGPVQPKVLDATGHPVAVPFCTTVGPDEIVQITYMKWNGSEFETAGWAWGAGHFCWQ